MVDRVNEPGPPRRTSVLAGQRRHLMVPIGTVGFLMIVPSAVALFLRGHYLTGTTGFVLGVCLGIDAIAAWLKRRPPIPLILLFIPMTAALLSGAYANPIYGALWCAAAVLLTFFIMSIQLATVASSALLFCVTAVVYQSGGWPLALCLALAVGFAIFVINLVTRVILELQQELLSQTVTDPLTGAFNRRNMELLLSEAHERRRRTGAPASIIILDIDHFKRVNDTFGHRVGDQVLRRLADEIRRTSRRLDRLFRYGGEEFVVLLPDTTGPNAMTQAERLRNAVAAARLHNRTQVTVSLGVAELLSNETIEAWVQRADVALYAAKRAGRNRTQFAAAEHAGERAPATVQA